MTLTNDLKENTNIAMIKSIVLLCLLPFMCHKNTFAQNNDKCYNLSFSGRLEEKAGIIDTITLRYDKDYFGTSVTNCGIIFKIPVKDKKFKFKSHQANETGYLTISYQIQGENSAFSQCYLFSLNDQLNCIIKKKGIDFIGAKMEKYKFIDYSNNISLEMNFQLHLDSNYYPLVYKFYDSIFHLEESRLNTIKSNLSDKEYQILLLNSISKRNYRCALLTHGMKFSGDKSFQELTRFYSQRFHLLYPIKTPDKDIWLKSMNYCECLYADEFLQCDLVRPVDSITNSRMKFYNLYNAILNRYEGQMRDKVLSYCFINFSSDEDFIKLLGKATDLVNRNGTTYKILKDLNSKFGYGANPFPINLPDARNRNISLKSLKGKVVVIDFWFTGCSGCASLAEAMTPIIRKYKDNRKVVFMSISVDKSKSKWLKSLSNNMYTIKESINVYTNGQGEQHPLITYYNLETNGFPQLIVIGKNNKIFSGCPPRPSYPEETKKFESLIDSALAE